MPKSGMAPTARMYQERGTKWITRQRLITYQKTRARGKNVNVARRIRKFSDVCDTKVHRSVTERQQSSASPDARCIATHRDRTRQGSAAVQRRGYSTANGHTATPISRSSTCTPASCSTSMHDMLPPTCSQAIGSSQIPVERKASQWIDENIVFGTKKPCAAASPRARQLSCAI